MEYLYMYYIWNIYILYGIFNVILDGWQEGKTTEAR